MIVIVTTADGQEHNFDNATAVSINGVPLEEETTEQKWERFLVAARALEDGHSLYYDNHEDLVDKYHYGEYQYEVGVTMRYGTLYPILASDAVQELWEEVVSDLGSVPIELEVDGVTLYHEEDGEDLLESYGMDTARDEWVKSKDFYSDDDYRVSKERESVHEFA